MIHVEQMAVFYWRERENNLSSYVSEARHRNDKTIIIHPHFSVTTPLKKSALIIAVLKEQLTTYSTSITLIETRPK